MQQTIDPFTDPSLRASYRQPRSATELCAESHYWHMQLARQDEWRKDLFARVDQMRAEQEAKLAKDLEVWRRTGKMPGTRTVKKRKP